jgi:hypothetical protein
MDVGLHQSIRVQFDRFLLPSITTRQAICVESATTSGPPSHCPGGVFLSPQYDPVDRVMAWIPGNAGFTPRTRYTVRLVPPESDSDLNGIRAFDGVPLSENTPSFAFTTGSRAASTLTEPNRKIDFCYQPDKVCSLPDTACSTVTQVDGHTAGPSDVLSNGGCSGPLVGCHAASSTAPTSLAGSAFALRPEDGNVSAAIQRIVSQAVVATETATGPNPDTPERSAATPFAQNMPYIDAHSPGNSFLLYKVLLGMAPRCQVSNEESATHDRQACSDTRYASPVGFDQDTYDCTMVDAGPLASGAEAGCTAPFTGMPNKLGTAGEAVPAPIDSWVPAEQWGPPVAGEYDRLRLHIRGQSMPPNLSTSYAQILTLSAWIAQGAPSNACP